MLIGCVAYSDWSARGISRHPSALEPSDWSTCPRELQLPMCICGLRETTTSTIINCALKSLCFGTLTRRNVYETVDSAFVSDRLADFDR